jgi:hypothetical protein
MSYVDLGADGPLVFEAPPNLQGILLDFWQRPIPVDGGKFRGDVGLPGPDAGTGGKFLLGAAGLRRSRAVRPLRLSLGDQQRLRVPARVLPGRE